MGGERGTQVIEKERKKREKVEERKKERRGEKERKKEKKRKERRREGWKAGQGLAAVGGGGRRPEVAGGGRLKPQGRSGDGASLVEMVKMSFWKRGFGERSYSSLERARRGEEGGMVVGG